MCGFEIEIERIEVNGGNEKYGFVIMHPISFNESKAYATYDRNDVLFYTVQSNRIVKLLMEGDVVSHLTKRGLSGYSTHFTFRMRGRNFVVGEGDSSTTTKFSVGQRVFVQSNLIYECCDRI
jgi:hypothetical protein